MSFDRSSQRLATENVLATSRKTTDGGRSSPTADAGNGSEVFVALVPSSFATSVSGRMHALVRSGATATGGGGVVSHSSVANAQRGTNAHPGSGDTALGTDPASAASLRSRAVSRVSRERISPWV